MTALCRIVFVASVVTAWAASAQPYVISLADPSNIRLSGAAGFAEGVLQLTPDEPRQSGSAFWSCPIRLDEAAAFQVELVFQIDGTEGSQGADGLAFVIQAGPAGAAALGHSGGALAFGGVAPGIGIEFDTYKNTTDPNDNHVGIVAAGNPYSHREVATSPVDMNGGQPVRVIINYDAASTQLTIAVGESPVPTLVTTEALEALVGRTGYVGLVAATGAKKNRHRVLSWSMTVEGQTDTDGDGLLDDCDSDDDGDEVPDAEDNCPLIENPEQEDEDKNRVGDACETETEDADEDGLTGAEERAAGTDPLRADSDLDTILDGDEAPGGLAPDSDSDGFVDPLDSDSDGDGILDQDEAGDDDLSTPPVDSDGDGTPDYRDTDSDDDGVNDKRDRCRTVADPDQSDLDKDGWGDACDADADGDGILEDGDRSGVPGDRPCNNQTSRCDDNCPGKPNSPQKDTDQDGIGDACDPDFEEEIQPSERPAAPGSESAALGPNDGSSTSPTSGRPTKGGTLFESPERSGARSSATGSATSGRGSGEGGAFRAGQGMRQRLDEPGASDAPSDGSDPGSTGRRGRKDTPEKRATASSTEGDPAADGESNASDSQLMWFLLLIAGACVGVLVWARRR